MYACAGHKAVDNHGVPGRRIGPRLDENGSVRGTLHRHHTTRNTARSQLSSLGRQTSPRHQRYIAFRSF